MARTFYDTQWLDKQDKEVLAKRAAMLQMQQAAQKNPLFYGMFEGMFQPAPLPLPTPEDFAQKEDRVIAKMAEVLARKSPYTPFEEIPSRRQYRLDGYTFNSDHELTPAELLVFKQEVERLKHENPMGSGTHLSHLPFQEQLENRVPSPLAAEDTPGDSQAEPEPKTWAQEVAQELLKDFA